ncbi:hypothetical protein [Caulobacter segnis]|jgi:hypothetical protein|nr:hypothetical protein [Caulobacter segnis]UAL09605.1 hypothetical protein K8940_17760 [Caulobacter segnis]
MIPADPTTAKIAALSARFALGVGEVVLNLALSAAVPVSIVVFAALTF